MGFDAQFSNKAKENIKFFANQLEDSVLMKMIYKLESHLELLNAIPFHYKKKASIRNNALEKAKTIFQLISEKEEKYREIGDIQFAWLLQNVRLLVEAVDLQTLVQEEAFITRESYMAENVKWILTNNPESKLILWAHNLHVSKGAYWMGGRLKKQFPDLVSIGFATYSGQYSAFKKNEGWTSNHTLKMPPVNSYESFFHQIKVPDFYINLHPEYWASKSNFCFPEKRKFRSIGSGVSEVEFFNTNLTEDFDILIYLDKTTATSLR